MSIISKISEILDERGITAAQMSRDLGFSSGLFSQWKRGKQVLPCAVVCRKISRYCTHGCTRVRRTSRGSRRVPHGLPAW